MPAYFNAARTGGSYADRRPREDGEVQPFPVARRLLGLPPGRPPSRRTTDGRSRDIMTATMKRIVRDRGFGFIRDAEGREDFVHQSAVRTPFTDLTGGATVEFDAVNAPKGPRAEVVRLKR